MKLLQVINSLGAGGAEKLVTEMSKGFSSQGLKVTVLLLDATKSSLYHKLKEHADINILQLGKGGSIYSPLQVFKIRQIIKEFDIIHVHLFPCSYWVALAKWISFKKPKILFTEHNTNNRRREKPLFKYIDRWVYKQYHCIVSISDAVDTSLKSYLGNSFDNIIKVYNGIQLETFTNAEPYLKTDLGFKKNDVLLVQVSSFTPQKDQKTAIKALKTLPEEVHLLLVGEGPMKQEVQNLSNHLNLSHRVHFLGVRSDVPRILKSVDIVCLASHYEGLSLSCVEGMASGKPLIASNTPGLGDIVKETGLVFEDNNAKQMSELINNLLEDKDLYNETIQKCLLKAKQFNINKMISDYINVYNEVLKKL